MNIVARYLLALVPLLSMMVCRPLSSPGGSAPLKIDHFF